MANTIDINPSSVLLDIKSDDRDGALKELLETLVQQKIVEEQYISQVINRENSYPTGLVFNDITIALPHGDPIGVNKSAMAIGRCHKNIEFYLMDDNSHKVSVDVIILLAINNPNGHMRILSNLIQALQKKEICEVLKNEESIEKLCTTLQTEILKKGENEDE